MTDNVNPYFVADERSDKEKYIACWCAGLSDEDAEKAWKLKQEFAARYAPMVAPDLPGYESPVSGKWIEGRAARREDLKQTGCRPYEEGEREEHKRQMAHEEKKNDAERYEAVAKTFYTLPESKRRALTRARG